eukprot:CAMPEP_0175990712 /NCGR_PEP_ID=MMETSP0108-20121206/52449_1 /TAXON_ID=195067 ORGANISM="Goniomonas pacifica, Strain CCMP1869" /NCGR_SAMPLE_ID=MMETSP0108 /ASSEMBLY_ACC=CAM_ASM_000204 /LENGTH=199 /DNA_ID=CAMNT_0017322195 /DNA_START=15 /DNA_END=612 /DNA_ORIENTATION=-
MASYMLATAAGPIRFWLLPRAVAVADATATTGPLQTACASNTASTLHWKVRAMSWFASASLTASFTARKPPGSAPTFSKIICLSLSSVLSEVLRSTSPQVGTAQLINPPSPPSLLSDRVPQEQTWGRAHPPAGHNRQQDEDRPVLAHTRLSVLRGQIRRDLVQAPDSAQRDCFHDLHKIWAAVQDGIQLGQLLVCVVLI